MNAAGKPVINKILLSIPDSESRATRHYLTRTELKGHAHEVFRAVGPRPWPSRSTPNPSKT